MSSIAIGQPIVDYRLAVKNRDRLLARFQKQPDYARLVDYYRKNIGKVTSVDDLLKDRRLLTVALSAFQLESQIDAKGILKKLLTEDPADPNSVAQRMRDKRYTQFALAFASLRNDGGKQTGSQQSVNTVLAAFETNEFEKWLGRDDPAVRQALYFQRKIGDSIELRNFDQLFEGARTTPEIADAISYYKDNIGKVRSVSELVADKKLLNVVLTAFDLEGLVDKPETVRAIILQGTTAPNALAQVDPRYKKLAEAFSSLAWDGGIQLRSASGVNAVVNAFETKKFEALLGSTKPKDRETIFGHDGAAKVGELLTQFRQTSAYVDATTYYRANIGKVRSADDLLKDSRLLTVALSAFDLDSLRDAPDTVRRLLTEDPAASDALAQIDPRYKQFAEAFGALRAGGTGTPPGDRNQIDAVLAAYEANEFGKSLAPRISEAQATDGSLTIYQIFADKTLTEVARAALNLPTSVGLLKLDQQVAAYKRAGFDVDKLQDPVYLKKFIDRFLITTGMEQMDNTPSLLSILFQPADNANGLGGMDLSVLLGNGGRINFLA